MKKNLVNLLILSLFIFACRSTAKLVEQGDYDKVIDRTIKKILKDKADNEDIANLDKSYKLANTRDLERIKLLKSENNPANWEQIYLTYNLLDNRQKNVRKVLPLKTKGNTIDYKQIDYTNQIVEAKNNAADYFYQTGKNLMGVNSKQSYRDAFYNFSKVKSYNASAYSDLEQLLSDAKYFGTSRVLIDVRNNTSLNLPGEFYDNVLAVNTTPLNTNWTEYYIGKADQNTEYDYFITILIQSVAVTPEKIDQKEFLRKKEIEDGFSYALDSRGNVMKDSLGNDIKIPRYKEISCTLLERHQFKQANVESQLEYYTVSPNKRVIKLVSVGATSTFENVFGKSVGDKAALNEEDMKLLQKEPLKFPDDISMIIDCSVFLKESINQALIDNKNLIY